MSIAPPSPPFNLAEPIPGYRTQRRIGAGGYGEVWQADAPGGIAKAIKIVYGYHDSDRAARELAALNRIKEVRHPFVLSIERIELLDGHLVIVTELADSSLRTVFDQCRQEGAPGIPRAELLGYLGDAADALDHLSSQHNLQHLDVKPENLLRMGGRIKVADFGLVKDLQDVRCSMISGLTPVYAAPELFDGRPNRHSDQYSLAIVYQEMLTGTPPFEGRTTAQLAAQHLHSRPRLDRLPGSDQAILARALAKNPDQRFASCREMVDCLYEVTPNCRSNAPRFEMRANSPAAPLPTPLSNKTEVLSPAELVPERDLVPAVPRPSPPPLEPAPPMRDLGPLEFAPHDVTYAPAIVLGIGGLAARALTALQRRLANRFGDLGAVPALQLLLLDTDAETLKLATDGGAPDGLSNDAAILVPLRPSADYRQDLDSHLEWLSRRWMYNIPRSLQTQGLRPLGRLAFVDHLERVVERLRRAVRAAVEPQGLESSARQTGLPFRAGPPRVFVVSSIMGGTGSGMLLDAGYVLRKILRELGMADEGLCALLAYGRNRAGQGRDLAVANAHALLDELYHYSQPSQAYPGDPARGLPAFPPEDAPFSHTYLLHFGEDLDAQDFFAGAEQIARYLYCNTVTPAGTFFDRCRAAEHAADSPGADPTVRTFGLYQLGFTHEHVPASEVDTLCQSLVLRWRGAARAEPNRDSSGLSDPGRLLAAHLADGLCEEELRRAVHSRAAAMRLEMPGLLADLQTLAATEMGGSPESYLLAALPRLAGEDLAHPNAGLPPGELVLDTLDALICSSSVQAAATLSLEKIFAHYAEQRAADHGAVLRQWILEQAAALEHGLQRAERVSDVFAEHLRGLSHEAGERLPALRQQLDMLKHSLLSDKNGSRDWLRTRGIGPWRKTVVDDRLTRYFRTRIEELSLNVVCRLTGYLLRDVAAVDDKLRNLAADLNRLADECAQAPRDTVVAASGNSQAVVQVLRGRTTDLLAKMEEHVRSDMQRLLLAPEDTPRGRLLQDLRRTAQTVILAMLKEATLERFTAASESQSQEPVFSLPAGLALASPRLQTCGGARRLLLLMPESLALNCLSQAGRPSGTELPTGSGTGSENAAFTPVAEQFSRQLSQAPTVVSDPENDLFLCYEGEQLPLRRVAAAVIDRRPENVELAARLHTRVDVDWSPV